MAYFTFQIDARARTVMMIFCQRIFTARWFMQKCTHFNEFKFLYGKWSFYGGMGDMPQNLGLAQVAPTFLTL